jgi:hypothetical protein
MFAHANMFNCAQAAVFLSFLHGSICGSLLINTHIISCHFMSVNLICCKLAGMSMRLRVSTSYRALGDGAPASWHCSDFLGFVNTASEDYDIVLMSFALHHLNTADKAILISDARRLLEKRYVERSLTLFLLPAGASCLTWQSSQLNVH